MGKTLRGRNETTKARKSASVQELPQTRLWGLSNIHHNALKVAAWLFFGKGGNPPAIYSELNQ